MLDCASISTRTEVQRGFHPRRARGLPCAVYGLLAVGCMLVAAPAPAQSRPFTTAPAAATSLTIADIAAALARAERKLPDILVSFTTDMPAPPDGQPNSPRRKHTTETFARHLPEQLIYHQITVQYFDPRSGTLTRDARQDRRSMFDGRVTAYLELQPNRFGQRLAIIYPGRHGPILDNVVSGCFQSGLWRPGAAMSFADLFNQSHCTVVDDASLIDGVQTVRVDGTLVDQPSQFRLWFAPSRSWLLLKREFRNTLHDGTVLHFDQELSDLTQLENGVWYPRTIRLGRLDDPVRHTIIRVTRASSAPISPGFFRPRFPLNTQVSDLVANRTYTTGQWLLPTAGVALLAILLLVLWLTGHLGRAAGRAS